MAKGRMINNTIVFDAKIHRLSCDTSRLAFTWLVSFADVEGRTYGDPAIVRSLLFPRRSDVTIDDVAEYIQEWHDQELIILYEAEDDKWIQFINFEKNQVGMRKDREAPTNIPAPPLRSKSGVSPELVPLNRTEQNRTEQNRTEQEESCGGIFKKYENNIAMLTESSQKTINLPSSDKQPSQLMSSGFNGYCSEFHSDATFFLLSSSFSDVAINAGQTVQFNPQ